MSYPKREKWVGCVCVVCEEEFDAPVDWDGTIPELCEEHESWIEDEDGSWFDPDEEPEEED